MSARGQMEDAFGGFEAWYREQHGRLLGSLVLVTGGDVAVARDATDEAFARALAAWPRISVTGAPNGWVYRVGVNLVRRHHRRRQLERALLRRASVDSAVPPPAGEALAVLSALPRRQQVAVVLRYIGDLTEPEIAGAMGVTRGTVSKCLYEARRTLAEWLREPSWERSDV